jgi:hypothetical protein
MTAHSTLEPRELGARIRSLPHIYAGTRERLSMNLHSTVEPCRLPVQVPIPVRRPTPKVAPLALALCVALGAALATTPSARASASWETTADGRLVDVQVMVEGGATPLFMKPGAWDRRYFQAFRGRNYSLAVTNNTGRRVGVLIAVDGLNVVNGERSRLSGTEAMYVLDPHERAVIRGWRTSLRDVRRFVFVDEERSYAERTGQANGDMGWIRVLSFREQQPLAWTEPRVKDGDERQPYGSRESKREGEKGVAPQEPGRDSGANEGRPEAQQDGSAKQRADSFRGQPAPESNPGTGWGEQSWDPVQRTVFLAVHAATDRIVLRYEYESGLRALGIFPRRPRTWDRERGELSFAQPPRR